MKKRKPKIILWDIETLPNLVKVLEVFPSLSNFEGRTLKATINSIICVGWKELGKKQVHCINAWDYPEWHKNWRKHKTLADAMTAVNQDKKLCKDIYNVLKDADVIVTHNGKRFDLKFLKTRLRKHKLGPLPKIHHIDTLSENKKHHLLYSNSLDNITKEFTDSRKLDNGGWGLWCATWFKDPKAIKKMSKYCKGDVLALEAAFKSLMEEIDLPNMNLFNGHTHSCPNCGSLKVQRRGDYPTKTARVYRYQCQDCGKWSSETKKGLK